MGVTGKVFLITAIGIIHVNDDNENDDAISIMSGSGPEFAEADGIVSEFDESIDTEPFGLSAQRKIPESALHARPP